MSVIYELGARIANSPFVDNKARERTLASIQEVYPWATIAEFEQVVERYLAASPNIVTALLNLIDGPTLANLANQVAGDEHFCSVNAPPYQAARRLLGSLGASTIVWNSNYRGIDHIRDRVRREESEFNRRRRSRREMSGAELSHYGIVVWKEVEALLKICARFYYRALYQPDGSTVSRALNHLNCCVSLGQLLQAIWDLEAGMDEQAKQQCYYLFERSSPFYGLLDQSHTLDLTAERPEWREQYERYNGNRRQTMPSYTGPYWAEVFRTDVQIYRNFYAHENEDVVLADGIDKAVCSFEAARRMLDYMLSNQVANSDLVPRLVVPIERGVDHLGRQTAKLVKASDLNDDETYRSPPIPVYRLAEWNQDLQELDLFQFYLCCPLYELVLNPVIIPLADIRPETLRENEEL